MTRVQGFYQQETDLRTQPGDLCESCSITPAGLDQGCTQSKWPQPSWYSKAVLLHLDSSNFPVYLSKIFSSSSRQSGISEALKSIKCNWTHLDGDRVATSTPATQHQGHLWHDCGVCTVCPPWAALSQRQRLKSWIGYIGRDVFVCVYSCKSSTSD